MYMVNYLNRVIPTDNFDVLEFTVFGDAFLVSELVGPDESTRTTVISVCPGTRVFTECDPNSETSTLELQELKKKRHSLTQTIYFSLPCYLVHSPLTSESST